MRSQFRKFISLLLAGILFAVPLQALPIKAMTLEELPEGELILSAANLADAILKPGSEAYGSMEAVDVEGESFTEAFRFATNVQPSFDYDFQFEIPIEAAIEKDDVMLASFYARTISSVHESGEATVSLVMEKLGTWEKSITEKVSVPGQWKQFLVPIKAALDMGTNESHVTLRLGYKPQVIEIAALQVVNYKKSVAIDDLPSTPVYYEGMEEDAPWRAEANKRIEEIRKGDLEIVVKDADGQPVEGADVHVKMTKHDFHFGTAVNSAMIFGTDENSEIYREKLKENFSSVVMENELKWPWWESDKARTVRLYNWLGENGFDVRGHTLIWDGLTRMPNDIGGIVHDPDQMHKRIQDHFHEVAGYFKGRLIDWDVLNEPTANKTIRSVYGDEIAADWFKLAKEADPYAKLYVNETQILGLDGPVIQSFSDFLETLVENDAPVDGVGIQAHFGGAPVSPMAFYNQLTHFTQYADEIAITEFDMNSPREDVQAMFTRDLLLATFSHPNVKSFTMWGFWDGAHWQSNAPLYRADWSLKPAGEEWQRLIYDVWWTDEQGVTDAEGAFSTRGFYGDYEVIVSYNGIEQTNYISLTKGADNTVSIILGGAPIDERPTFEPMEIPDQNAEITAPVWPHASVFSASDAAPTSVTLKWPAAHDNIAVDHYLLYQDGSLLAQIPAHVTSYDVTGLAQNHSYVYTVEAVDQHGNHSVASEEIRVTTPSGADNMKPGWSKGSSITVSDLTESGAVISWPQGKDNVGAASYRIYMNGQSFADTTERSFTLSGLLENTEYTVRVEAKDELGNLSNSGPLVVFRTLGTEDTIPPTWGDSSFTASGITANSLTLNWTSAQDNREVTAYRLFKGNEEMITLPSWVTSYEVKGLSENTGFFFKIQAGDGHNNWSDATPQVNVTTAVASDDAAPTWPVDRSLTYSSLTDREVTLSWSPAADNIGVAAYRIYKNEAAFADVDGSANQLKVTDLNAGQSYTFRVEAVDLFGNSSINGPAVTFVTYAGLVRQQFKLSPSDDAFPQAPTVFGGEGTTNNVNYLRYKNAAGVSGSEQNKNTGNNRRVYMKFPLDTVTGSVYEASLHLNVYAVQTPNMDISMDVYATGDDWSENSINWINKPAAGMELAHATIRNAGYWKTISVTDYAVAELNGDKQISFLIQDDSWLDQNVDFHSKEASDAALRPYLLIETEAVEEDTTVPIWNNGILSNSKAKPNGVTLKWSGASDDIGIIGYHLYQNDVLVAVVGADANSFEVTNLNPSTAYEFRVEAKDTRQESADGPTIQLTTPDADRQVPIWPGASALAADKVSRSHVTLSWTPAEDEYGIDQYVIYEGDRVAALLPGSTASHTVTGLAPSASFEFSIAAVDAAGNRAEGPSVTVETLAADAAAPAWEADSELTVSIGTTGVYLQWPEASDDTSVAGYEVNLGEELIAELEASVTSYYIQGLTDNTPFAVSVAARDAAGNRSEQLVQTGTTLQLDTITPVWPSGSRLTSKLTGGNVQLQWDPAVDNVVVNNYLLYRNGTFLAAIDGRITSYIVAGETDLNAIYKVEAEDITGNASKNGPSTSDPEITVPSDTTAPAWPNGSELRADSITQTSLRLVWDAATDHSGIAGYRLVMDGDVLADPIGRTWLVERLTPGQSYLFKVEAADAAGNWTIDGPALTVRTLPSPSPITEQPHEETNAQAPQVKVENGQVVIEMPAAASADGRVNASIQERLLSEAFAKAKEDAAGNHQVTIVIPRTGDAASYAIGIPAEILTRYGEQASIKLTTELGSLVLPGDMLENNAAAAKHKTITVSLALSELPNDAAIQGKVGSVIDLHVEADGKALAYRNKDAAVTVEIPYTLSGEERENMNWLSVWHVDEQGHAQLVPTGKYVSATKTIRFETDHFSKFAVTYISKSFDDLSQASWAREAIQALASKGIINGVSDRSFHPGASITRADFTKIVIEALSLTAAANETFKDIRPDDYYYNAVSTALSLGIIQGSGDGKFNPEAPITRQDMMVILARALEHAEPAALSGSAEALAAYQDKSDIAGYAEEPIAALVNIGLVQGNNGRMEPKKQTSRAEAAVIVYNMFQFIYPS